MGALVSCSHPLDVPPRRSPQLPWHLWEEARLEGAAEMLEASLWMQRLLSVN